MFFFDIPFILRFWGALFLFGAAAYPATKLLFGRWWDRGYLLAKALGLAVVTYAVWFAGTIRMLPYTNATVILFLIVLFGVGVWLGKRNTSGKKRRFPRKELAMLLALELFFLLMFGFWSWIKGHEASINGLEKFMDYGFTQTIMNSSYFPPQDMWYAGEPINYYYFGHVVMATVTKLSGVDLAYGFNLMLAALFAFCFTMSFTIGVQVMRLGLAMRPVRLRVPVRAVLLAAGLLSAVLVTLAGNMQTIYAFTKGYTGEDVEPFWELAWRPSEFLERLPEGMERYWYANATRFIPFTIHEFPSYSFVVSDVHGHVLNIPFVLLAIALLVSMFLINRDRKDPLPLVWAQHALYGLLLAVHFMTNALDGLIYGGLFFILLLFEPGNRPLFDQETLLEKMTRLSLVLVAGPAILPFIMSFRSFVTGVAVNCPPAGLAGTSWGPILFEDATKCQRSPFWMMWLLWGFFWFTGIWFIRTYFRFERDRKRTLRIRFTRLEWLFAIVYLFSTLLLVFPELFYFRDIYPAHFRSNTMFKLGYQAFILMSLAGGYVIVREAFGVRARTWTQKIFLLLLVPQLLLILIFPYFAVRSYFGGLRQYTGLNGLTWFAREYPSDYNAVQWLSASVIPYMGVRLPVIAEADSDSYTHGARISAFAGTPTIIGWAVHEWLWRGSYDVVAPRRDDVRKLYEDPSDSVAREIITRYGVSYVVVGAMEREKYPGLDETRFDRLGTLVYDDGTLGIWDVRTTATGRP